MYLIEYKYIYGFGETQNLGIMKNTEHTDKQQLKPNQQKKNTLTFNPFKLLFRALKRAFHWYDQNILDPINEFFAGCEIKPMFERNVEAFERAVKEKQQREGTSSPSEGGTPRGMFSEDPVMDSILKGQVFNQMHHGHKSSHDTHWWP